MSNDHDYGFLVSSILNIPINKIEDISVSNKEERIYIYVILKHDNNLLCPKCGKSDYVGNGFYAREIIVDNDFIINEKVYLRVKRYLCNHCGSSFSDSCNLSPKNKTVSYKIVFRIMELLKSSKMTFAEVGKLMNLSPQTVTRVFDQNCHIPRIKLPEAICIDEVYTKVNDYKDSKYSCIFYDFYLQKVVEMLPCRRKNYLGYYLDRVPKNELDDIKYVCIDMYQPYKDVIKLYMKKATLCVDSFHVIKHIGDDLNRLRIRIMNQYDSSSKEYYLLSRFKFLLFDRSVNLDNKGKFNKVFHCYLNYRQLLEMILSINPQLAEGYRLKEQYILFNQKADYESAKEYIDLIIDEFINANINEFSELVTLLKNWKTEIINSFIRYKGRRLNSGIAESINQTIANLIYNTKGIRNSERRRKRIMYAVNKEGFVLR